MLVLESFIMDASDLFRQVFDEWATPHYLFDALHGEFGFTLDACATERNAKCARYFTRDMDGLAQDWGTERVFMNPPCSNCGDWMHKASASAARGALVVALVPSRTDTDWWHRYAMAGEIRFLKGRLRIGACNTTTAPFASAVVVLRPVDLRLYHYDKT